MPDPDHPVEARSDPTAVQGRPRWSYAIPLGLFLAPLAWVKWHDDRILAVVVTAVVLYKGFRLWWETRHGRALGGGRDGPDYDRRTAPISYWYAMGIEWLWFIVVVAAAVFGWWWVI